MKAHFNYLTPDRRPTRKKRQPEAKIQATQHTTSTSNVSIPAPRAPRRRAIPYSRGRRFYRYGDIDAVRRIDSKMYEALEHHISNDRSVNDVQILDENMIDVVEANFDQDEDMDVNKP